MTVTPPTLALISKRFRDPSMPRINQSQMAEHMGYGKAWASKLMGGKIQNLSDDQVSKLEEFLGIRLSPYIQENSEPVSELAMQLSRRMRDSEPLSRVVSALLEIPAETPVEAPKWFSTHDMTKLGNEIIRIVNENPEKPGKIARLVLEQLR